MANNPFAGRVPLNYRQGCEEEVSKAVENPTSYRPGETHELKYRTPHNDRTVMPRNDGCTHLRRYADGRLDVPYVCGKIIEIIHKMKDAGHVTEFEKALLAMALPHAFQKLIDEKIAKTMTKLSSQERMMLGLYLSQHLREELNWNAGLGGGSVPGRGSTRS
jgi:hypothetical protein